MGGRGCLFPLLLVLVVTRQRGLGQFLVNVHSGFGARPLVRQSGEDGYTGVQVGFDGFLLVHFPDLLGAAAPYHGGYCHGDLVDEDEGDVDGTVVEHFLL